MAASRTSSVEAAFVEALGDLALVGAFQDGEILAALSDGELAMELSKSSGLPQGAGGHGAPRQAGGRVGDVPIGLQEEVARAPAPSRGARSSRPGCPARGAGPVLITEVGHVKKLLWGVAGIAAVVVVSMLVLGYPRLGQGTEGTSGGAQRYVGKPLSAKDVQVADSDVQRFIQSHTFDRLVRNSVTRKALAKAFEDSGDRGRPPNPALVKALQDEEVREALSNPLTAAALANPDFRKHFADLELRSGAGRP